MKKYVCLRDDDTNYWTSIDELKAGYGAYWGHIPITLGVVPFSHGSQGKMLDFEHAKDRCKSLREWEKRASAEELTEYHKLYPIAMNIELVRELKCLQDKGMIEIAQHGVSHRYSEFGAETQSHQISYPMIRDGKEYLEKVFETRIETYIPPSNTIDSVCAKYIHSLEMNLFCSGSIIYKNYINKAVSYLISSSYLKEKIRRMRYIPIRKINGLFLFGSFTFGAKNIREDMFNKIRGSLQETGFAALGTHYMLLNPAGYKDDDGTYHREYMKLLDEIQSIEGVEFVTAKDYYSHLMEKYYE